MLRDIGCTYQQKERHMDILRTGRTGERRVSLLLLSSHIHVPGTYTQQRCQCVVMVTPQLLRLTLGEWTSHTPSNGAIWDLSYDLSCDLLGPSAFAFWKSLKSMPVTVLSETQYVFKTSLKSSAKSGLIVNIAPSDKQPRYLTSFCDIPASEPKGVAILVSAKLATKDLFHHVDYWWLGIS